MKENFKIATRQGLAAALLFLAPGAGALEGLEPLQRALGAGREQVRMFEAYWTRERIAAAEPVFAIDTAAWAKFPAPDAATLAWLASRIPGLDAANVRVVPADASDAAIRRAVASKITYLDVFSDDAFNRKELYFLSAETLQGIHRKFISGTIPIQGSQENGKPFSMQAFVAGQSRVQLLFDRNEFTFKDDGNRLKIDNGGRVAAAVLGPGDISVEGFSAYGAPVFCPWAKIKRMTKESMYKVRVETSCGSRGGNNLEPVRAR